MALEYKKDYVYSPKIWNGLTDAVFIGTKEYVFVYPIKSTAHTSRKTTETEFFIKGDKPDKYFEALLEDPETSMEKLIDTCKQFADANEEAHFLKISDFKKFRVTANFFSSMVYLANKMFDAHTFTKLGKNKKDIKEFYNN